MSAKARGTTAWVPATTTAPGHYKSRITLAADPGVRPWIHHDASPRSPEAERSARGKAEHWTERARDQKLTRKDFGVVTHEERAVARAATTLPPKAETADDWYTRFQKARGEDLGIAAARHERYRWDSWVSPVIGAKPIAGVTKSNIEDVRDALDAAVRRHAKEGRGEGRIAAKTALNVWSTLVTAFKQAVASKRRDLRVREDNPCVGVLPPDTGDSRAKTFIYPHEFLQLAACLDVPLEWRELHTLAAFTYLRPGELRALLWSDVDLVHGIIHVTKAWDENAKKVKAPKTRNGVRDVPIHPNLVPLLKRMGDGRSLASYVLPLMSAESEDFRAKRTREHLALAGITRSRITEDNATCIHVGFRSWRDSGITWLKLAGLDVVVMQRRAGHDSISTTLGYVKLAEDCGGALGEPFPPLPDTLVSGVESSRESSSVAASVTFPRENQCEGGDLNPYGVTR